MIIVVFFDWSVLLFWKYPYSAEKIQTNTEMKPVGKQPYLQYYSDVNNTPSAKLRTFQVVRSVRFS